MKIVLTGSIGNIGKPLTQELVQKGHSVAVISSKTERKIDIETLGAKAAIGSLEDTDFLTTTFRGADAVYLMVPPVDYFDHSIDVKGVFIETARNYVQAIQESEIKRVVHLSSIGAHTEKGNGMLAFLYMAEQILKKLPEEVAITTLRPVGFYYNMFGFIDLIKTQGAIVQNYGGDEKEPWVSPLDIAAVVAEEIVKPFEGRKFRYVASDEVSPNEVAKILGEAIGKPNLKWKALPDKQLLNGMLNAGMTPQAAKGIVEMNAGRINGFYNDYNENKPVLGKVKTTNFAKEFATVFYQK